MSHEFLQYIRQKLGEVTLPKEIAPGIFVRFVTDGTDKSGWLKLFPDGQGGVFGDWRRGTCESWQADIPLAGCGKTLIDSHFKIYIHSNKG